MSAKQYTGRKLKRNHSNALPRYVIAYATETRNEKDADSDTYSRDIFTRGSLISCRIEGTEAKAIRPSVICRPQEFWDEVAKFSAPNYTTWIIGHSVLYEMVVSGMQEQFEQAKLVVEWPRSKKRREANNEDDPHSNALVIINNPPSIIACRCVASGGRVVIVDLLNWFNTSLSEIAETLNQDRDDFCRSIPQLAGLDIASMQKAGTVLAAFLKLIRWHREQDCGMFRYTAASQAMSAYRHRYMSEDIFIHDNALVKHLERKAHFGGRTEVFRYGVLQEKIHQLDVSSLFPSVMLNGEFPVKLEEFKITSLWSSNLPPIDWKKSVAKVWLKTRTPYYPVRMPQGNVYPIGEFDTVLCGEELEHAFLSGDLQSVQSWATYRTGRIFTEWVSNLWRLRQHYANAGDSVYAKLCKSMLNSLYGKFAQRGAKWVNLDSSLEFQPWTEWPEVDVRTGTRRVFRSFGWQLQEYVGETELPNTFVAISSFVASAARMRMNILREIAGKRNVYYQGVDGLIVTDAGRQRLDHHGQIAESELGKLRHQLTVDEGEILGYCDYRLGTKVVKSGLAGNAILTQDSELLQQLTHVHQSLFSSGQQIGIRKVDAYWHRQEMAAKNIADSDGFGWPFELSKVQSVGDDMLASVP